MAPTDTIPEPGQVANHFIPFVSSSLPVIRAACCQFVHLQRGFVRILTLCADLPSCMAVSDPPRPLCPATGNLSPQSSVPITSRDVAPAFSSPPPPPPGFIIFLLVPASPPCVPLHLSLGVRIWSVRPSTSTRRFLWCDWNFQLWGQPTRSVLLSGPVGFLLCSCCVIPLPLPSLPAVAQVRA